MLCSSGAVQYMGKEPSGGQERRCSFQDAELCFLQTSFRLGFGDSATFGATCTGFEPDHAELGG